MDDKKSRLTLSVSVKDTELFHTLLEYTGELIELLSEYPISEVDRRKLNEISSKFFEIEREVRAE